jgi:hypothetical protein
MTTFDQELTGGTSPPEQSDHHSTIEESPTPSSCVTPSAPSTTQTRKFGIDPADNGSLAELVDAAEEQLKHIANDVSQRSVMATPNTGGGTA